MHCSQLFVRSGTFLLFVRRLQLSPAGESCKRRTDNGEVPCCRKLVGRRAGSGTTIRTSYEPAAQPTTKTPLSLAQGRKDRGTTLFGAKCPHSAATAGADRRRGRVPITGDSAGQPYTGCWGSGVGSWFLFTITHHPSSITRSRRQLGCGFGACLLVELTLSSTRWVPGAARTLHRRRYSLFGCRRYCTTRYGDMSIRRAADAAVQPRLVLYSAPPALACGSMVLHH